jgi:hypothetical protein
MLGAGEGIFCHIALAIVLAFVRRERAPKSSIGSREIRNDAQVIGSPAARAREARGSDRSA